MPPSGDADGGIEERGIKPEGDAARESFFMETHNASTHQMRTACIDDA
jgi:hypothetical protein